MVGPFGTELVGTGQGAVTTADDECVDTVTDQVVDGRATALFLTESGAARGTDQGTSDRGETTDVVPADLEKIKCVSAPLCACVSGGRRTRMM